MNFVFNLYLGAFFNFVVVSYRKLYVLLFQSELYVFSVGFCSCWQYFTSLTDLTLTDSPLEEKHIHSEYFFGDCKRDDIKFFAHVHKDSMEVLGKIIIRGWLDLIRIPTCIILRATSYEEDLFRSTAYRFQMCVPRITYCHSQRRYKYYYYEWYIPGDMIGGMNWDIYFYGPTNLVWQ